MPNQKANPKIVSDLYLLGVSNNEIARQVGIRAVSVRKILRKLGIYKLGSGPQKKERPICLRCGKKVKTMQQTFCSRSCSATFYNKIRQKNLLPKVVIKKPKYPERPCSVCKTLHVNRFFCSRKCNGMAKRIPEEKRKAHQKLRNILGVQKYRAKKYSQTPPDADQNIIRMIYENCPEGYEVDHIIPISRGGLHHQNNLQYLTPLENKKKSNKILCAGSSEAERRIFNPQVEIS